MSKTNRATYTVRLRHGALKSRCYVHCARSWPWTSSSRRRGKRKATFTFDWQFSLQLRRAHALPAWSSRQSWKPRFELNVVQNETLTYKGDSGVPGLPGPRGEKGEPGTPPPPKQAPTEGHCMKCPPGPVGIQGPRGPQGKQVILSERIKLMTTNRASLVVTARVVQREHLADKV